MNSKEVTDRTTPTDRIDSIGPLGVGTQQQGISDENVLVNNLPLPAQRHAVTPRSHKKRKRRPPILTMTRLKALTPLEKRIIAVILRVNTVPLKRISMMLGIKDSALARAISRLGARCRENSGTDLPYECYIDNMKNAHDRWTKPATYQSISRVI
jgi:hypothetical protein